MAISTNAIFEIRPVSVGSATNGGGFDPSLTTNMDAVLAGTVANTASPSVTSANYTFAAGDVGAWLYISSGTGFIPGWYQIASVTAGAAILSAAIGAAVLANFTGTNTVLGCGTTATPSVGVWSIDYSQQNAVQVALTGESSSTTTVTTTSGAATIAWIGNAVYLSGTSATTGTYFVTNIGTVVGGVSTTFTIDRSAGAATTSLVVNMGGAWDVPNTAFATTGGVGSCIYWVKNTGNTTTYTANGTAPPAGATGLFTILIGYNSIRGDLDGVVSFTNHPLLQVNNASVDVLHNLVNFTIIANLAFDAGSGATKGANGISTNGTNIIVVNCKFSGAWTSKAIFFLLTQCQAYRCYVTGCAGTTGAIFSAGGADIVNCVAIANTCIGFGASGTGTAHVGCISANNTGTTSDGFALTASSIYLHNCISYGNGRDGVRTTVNPNATRLLNNILAKNGVSTTAYGVNASGGAVYRYYYEFQADYNWFYNNQSNNYKNFGTGGVALATWGKNDNATGLTADPFVSGSTGNFALTTAAINAMMAAGNAGGFPGTFSGIPTTGYLFPGAAQPLFFSHRLGAIFSRTANARRSLDGKPRLSNSVGHQSFDRNRLQPIWHRRSCGWVPLRQRRAVYGPGLRLVA